MAKKVKKKSPAKKKSGSKKVAGPKKASGLNIEKDLTPEMQVFMGKSKASMGDIIKEVWAYIKKHKLQDPKNMRWIIPDEKLESILGLGPTSMFKIPSKVMQHFV